MDNKLKPQLEERWPLWNAFLVFVIFCFFMVCPAAPERWNDLYSFYGKTLIIGTLALLIFVRRFQHPIELRLVLLYALWLLISRVLNSDTYMIREPELVLSKFLCAAMLSCGIYLNAQQRKRFLAFLCAALGLFYFVFDTLAIIANLLDTYFLLPPEDVLFGLDGPWHIHYINVFNTNRTISSLWFYLSFCLMVYSFLACKSKLLKIPIVLAGLVFYIAISLSFSRTVKLVTAVSVAMFFMLLSLKYLPLKKLWKKAAVICLCVAIFLPLSLKSFDLSTALLSRASAYMISATGVESVNAPAAEDQGEEAEIDGVDLSDNRDLKRDIGNLSERGQIFASFIPSLQTEPKRILIGSFSDKLMNVPNMFVDFPVPFRHMHNFLLETFMLTGAPGFLLVIAFCILLVARMLHVFFSSDSRISLAVKTLTIPLTGILLYGMSEVVIFTACSDQRAPTDIRELSFFILAGIVLGTSREVLPSFRHKK